MRTALLWIAAALTGCSSSTSAPDLARDASLEGPARDAPPLEGGARDLPVENARDAAAAACAPGTWCWVNPLPTGNRLNAIHGPSEKELYAVGEGGTLYRFDGTSWLALASGTTGALNAVHAIPGKVVAVGAAGTIVEGDGTSFKATVYGQQTLRGVCAVGDERFAVGDGGVVLRNQAGSWSTVPPPDADKTPLSAVFCAGASVWVAGEKGKLHRLDPTSDSWSSQVVGTSSSSHQAIWGSGSTLLLGGATGSQASLFRSEDSGKTWSPLTLPSIWSPITAIWGSGPNDARFVVDNRLFAYDGIKVSEVAVISIASELRALFGAGGALYLGGAGGALLRLQQGVLQAMLPSSTLTPGDLRAVHGSATVVVAVGEAGTILVYSGSAWKKLVVPETAGAAMNGVFAAPGGAIFVVGDGGRILRHQGGTWTAEPSPTTATLRAVWSDGNSVVAVGGDPGKPVLVHLEGGKWNTKAVPAGIGNAFASVWGSGPSDVYAAGDGKLVRYDGSAWALVTSPAFQGEPLRRIWGRGPAEVYVAGDWGNVFRFDGAGWTVKGAGAFHPRAISGDAQSILIALESGEIVRGTGVGWVRETTRCGNVLAGIWAGPKESWAVGANGTILLGR